MHFALQTCSEGHFLYRITRVTGCNSFQFPPIAGATIFAKLSNFIPLIPENFDSNSAFGIGMAFPHSSNAPVGDGDTIVYKDCDGNFAEVYHNESGEELVDLCQLGAADLDILGDLSFCDISSKAIQHLIQLGFGAENLPEFESCAKLHYFQSEVEPKVGDEISIGKNGRCRVEAIVGGELQARNIHTGELFTVFADDCDLLGRAELDDQASVVVAKLLAAGRGREASSLGQIIGAWRKGHVGDCVLRNAITGSERRLAETGTPAVERAQLAEIQ